MAFEDDLGWEYFGGDPMNSPKMMEHMDWHNAPENQNETGNYGERFFLFHQQFIDKFDAFRHTKGLLAVSGWDPTTPIPADLAHDHTLTAPRSTDNPFSINPQCKTPTWATVAGGTETDPLYGHTSLSQFLSLDQLGRSIDSGWHGTVHNTIGGDMKQFHSPIDPVFWRWHRWIDNVRVAWESTRHARFGREISELVQVLFGVTNDGGGIVILPNGELRPVPPRTPATPGLRSLSPAMREVLVGHLIGRIGEMLGSGESVSVVQKMATKLIGNAAKLLQ